VRCRSGVGGGEASVLCGEERGRVRAGWCAGAGVEIGLDGELNDRWRWA